MNRKDYRQLFLEMSSGRGPKPIAPCVVDKWKGQHTLGPDGNDDNEDDDENANMIINFMEMVIMKIPHSRMFSAAVF